VGASNPPSTELTYYGGLAQLICAGPITKLTRIANGDTVVWQGSVDVSSRDSDGKVALVTSLGTGYLFFGRSDDAASTDLAAAKVDYGTGATTVPIPAWRNWAKFILPNASFGTQLTPPTLKFDFERDLSLLAISVHQINGDAIIPEVIYDALTNALYSVGGDASLIDTASFVTACETTIAETLVASPQLDQEMSLRDFIGKLLSYVDGVIYWGGGQAGIKLIRTGDTPTAIDESDLTAEPEIQSGALSDTWNFTRLVFSDAANNWDQNAVEAWDNTANAAAQGENVSKDVEMPWFTQRGVAKGAARRKGIAGGAVVSTYTLSLKPSLSSIKPGDLLSLSYAKLGVSGKLVRVTARQTDGSKNSEIRVTAMTEISHSDTADYSPPDDPLFTLGAFYDESGGDFGNLSSVQPLLLKPPPSAQFNTSAGNYEYGLSGDGVLVAFNQPSSSIVGSQIWQTWDPAQQAYYQLTESKPNRFPVKALLVSWTPCRNRTRWLLRIQFDSQADADYLRSVALGSTKAIIVTARRLFKWTGATIDQHQVDGLWATVEQNGQFEVVSSLVYDVEVSSQYYDSPDFVMETAAGQGNYPCLTLFCGQRDDFHMFAMQGFNWFADRPNGGTFYTAGVAHNSDTSLVRYIKTLFSSSNQTEQLADVVASTFSREDFSMCPDGTFNQEWGVAILPQAQQYDYAGFAAAMGGASSFDNAVASLDADLYAKALGVSTEDQDFEVEGTDSILGFVIAEGISYYNDQL
jgi:Putative phage tail protein